MLNKGFYKTRTLWGVISCAVVAFSLQSCDERYDIENIGGDIKVFENGLSAPIGETQKFYLDDFIEENELLKVVDGRYVVEYSGTAQSSSFELPDVHIDKIDPELNAIHLDFMQSIHDELPELEDALIAAGYTGGPLPDIPGIEIPDAHATLVETTEHFNILINDIPEQVVNVKSMQPDEGTIVTLSLHAEGFPKTITHITFDIVVLPPAQIKLEPVEEDIWRDVDGYFHIVHDLPCVNGTLDDLVHFRVESIDFNPPLERQADNSMLIDTEIFFSGKVHINEPFSMAGWTPAFDLRMGYTMDATKVNRLEACVEAAIDPIELSEDITGLPDLLNDPGNCLDLQSVQMSLGINNKTPLALESDLNLRTLFADGSTSPLVATDAPIRIEANAEQSIVLTNDPQHAGQVGYLPNLHELVKKMPSNIYLKATPHIPPTDIVLTMGRSYSVDINYAMSLPIHFGNEVNLKLEANINGLDGNEQLLALANKVILYADIENTLPLDLNMTAVALDKNGNVMEGVKISGLPIIKGNSVTHMELQIETSGDEEYLANLSSLNVVIVGTSENGGELRPDQFMQFTKIALEVPEGISVGEVNL